MNPIGVNILAQYVKNTSALMVFLKASNPAAVIVMDGNSLAQTIRRELPETTVIHRAFNPNDAKWQDVISPQEWLRVHKPFAVNGVVLQVFNEPAPGDLSPFLTWLEQLVAICPNDITLALPAFAVGNPKEPDILNGKYDRLLKLVCGTRHFLILHEYFRDKPIEEAPYLCGRYSYWQTRADDLHWPMPKFVMGEHGRDIGGGRNDGWKGAGWTETGYFNRLVDAQSVYDDGIPVCIYCWGTGAGNDWLSFDIQDATELQAKIIQYGKDHPMTQPPVIQIDPPSGKGVQATLVKIPGDWINVRVQPNTSAQDIGNLYKGEVFTIWADKLENGWMYVTHTDGRHGWTSLQGDKVKFDVVGAPTPTPSVPIQLHSPLPNGVITAHFGEPRDYDGDEIKDDRHEGVDWALAPNPCAIGDVKVLASADGVVESVRDYLAFKATGKFTVGYGIYVKLKHVIGSDTWITWYCHLSAPLVCVGETVKQGDPIGILGSLGNSSGYHVHLNLQHIGHGLSGFVITDAVDPEQYLVKS